MNGWYVETLLDSLPRCLQYVQLFEPDFAFL
jgi:hypothetical protein